jgi:hypothetical protein
MKVKVRELMKAVSDAQRTGAKLGQPISSVPKGLDDLDHVVLKRLVHGYKGKWQILPSKVIENQSKA